MRQRAGAGGADPDSRLGERARAGLGQDGADVENVGVVDSALASAVVQATGEGVEELKVVQGVAAVAGGVKAGGGDGHSQGIDVIENVGVVELNVEVDVVEIGAARAVDD